MSLDSLMPSVMNSPSDRPEPVKSNANTVMLADRSGYNKHELSHY
jgi:hypothetical protein